MIPEVGGTMDQGPPDYSGYYDHCTPRKEAARFIPEMLLALPWPSRVRPYAFFSSGTCKFVKPGSEERRAHHVKPNRNVGLQEHWLAIELRYVVAGSAKLIGVSYGSPNTCGR